MTKYLELFGRIMRCDYCKAWLEIGKYVVDAGTGKVICSDCIKRRWHHDTL